MYCITQGNYQSKVVIGQVLNKNSAHIVNGIDISSSANQEIDHIRVVILNGNLQWCFSILLYMDERFLKHFSNQRDHIIAHS